jgi:hypothetical protein
VVGLTCFYVGHARVIPANHFRPLSIEMGAFEF